VKEQGHIARGKSKVEVCACNCNRCLCCSWWIDWMVGWLFGNLARLILGSICIVRHRIGRPRNGSEAVHMRLREAEEKDFVTGTAST
jgi:hypothetical protein